ncbi:MAG: hypothetical protein ACFE8U_16260 [Candidatus Hermodarchaeota archaeon]
MQFFVLIPILLNWITTTYQVISKNDTLFRTKGTGDHFSVIKETEEPDHLIKRFSFLIGPLLGYGLLNLLFIFQATLERGIDIGVWISAIIMCNVILVVLFHPLSILSCLWIYLWTPLLLLCHFKQKNWSENIRTLINIIFIVIGLVLILVAFFIDGFRAAFLFLWTILLWLISFNYTFFTWRIARMQHSISHVNWFWIIWVLFLSLVFLINPVMFRATI